MWSEQLYFFKNWFENYISNFDGKDEKEQIGMKIKEEHSWRVCSNIKNLGESLNLEQENIILAETIALFHDIGRFNQISLYKTFNDSKSEDHALLGARVLKENRVLASLRESEQELVLKAIENHNLYILPPNLKGRHLFFTYLLRDADKLDIFEVFTKYRNKDGYGIVLDSGLPDTPGYSKVLVDDLLHQRSCSFNDVKNSNDKKILQLSWLFDINFTYTLSEISKRGYIEKIINDLPRDQYIQKVYNYLNSYIRRRIKNQENKIVLGNLNTSI